VAIHTRGNLSLRRKLWSYGVTARLRVPKAEPCAQFSPSSMESGGLITTLLIPAQTRDNFHFGAEVVANRDRSQLSLVVVYHDECGGPHSGKAEYPLGS